MDELPVGNSDGSTLLAFDRHRSEHELDRQELSIPLTASLVVLWYGAACLMVFNRHRREWELPGGMLDPGESPREAAVRELEEESGQRPGTLDLAGVARTWFVPAQRLELLAIYAGRIASPLPFASNAEMSDSVWWEPGDELAHLSPIDAALATLCPMT